MVLAKFLVIMEQHLKLALLAWIVLALNSRSDIDKLMPLGVNQALRRNHGDKKKQCYIAVFTSIASYQGWGSQPWRMVLHNLRCELINDRVWCHIESLHTGMKADTLSEFFAPAVGPDDTVPMGPDKSSRQVRKGKFDAANNVSCAQVQGQSMQKCTARIARSGGGEANVVVMFSNGF